MPQTRSSLATRLLLALGTLLVVVAILERGSRFALGQRFVSGSATGIPQEAVGAFHPELGWVNKPGASTRIVADRFAYSARINSRGLRDREHPYQPPSGVVRIALLGDSVAWGWGVDDGWSLGDLLEEHLQPEAEVINLSVPGYSTDQQLWTLEGEGRRYKPALVLLCFVMNDVVGNRSLQTSGLGKPRYERDADGGWVLANSPVQNPGRARGGGRELSLLTRLHTRSGLLQLLRPFAVPDPFEAGADAEAPGLDPEQRDRFYEQHMARIHEMCDELSDRSSVHVMLLRRLKALCDELGAPLVVMPIPHHHDHYLYNPRMPVPAELATPEQAGEQPFRTRLTRVLDDLGEELGFQVIAVDQVMLEAARRGELLQVPDGHLNERGNALVAEVAAGALRPRLEALRPRIEALRPRIEALRPRIEALRER